MASGPAEFPTHNVATELKDPNSVLSIYKQVLALRHTNEAYVKATIQHSTKRSQRDVLPAQL